MSSHEATELSLYIDNTEPFYRWKVRIFLALAKKKKRGVFDRTLAPKAFSALTTQAAKDYQREHGSMTTRWSTTFPTSARKEVAEEYAEEFLDWYQTDYLTGSI